MPETNKELIAAPVIGQNNDGSKSTVELKELIFRNLHYLPVVIICGVVFIILAYVKIRYTIPTFRVQSSLLIKDENDRGGMSGGGGKDQRFEELFMNGGNVNLNNEVEILRSRPVLQRVARDLNLQIHEYSKGSIRSTLKYEDRPFEVNILRIVDSTQPVNLQINMLSDSTFLLNESKQPIAFGQPFQVGLNSFALMRNRMLG